MSEPYIGIGSGLRLLTEDWYIKEMGCTKTAFKKFCKALKVPRVQIGRKWYVEMTSFQLAIKHITKIGQEDFRFPGHGRRGSELDIKHFKENISETIAELLTSHKLQGGKITFEVREAAKTAANRMIAAGIHSYPEKAKRTFTKYAMKQHKDFLGDVKEVKDEFKRDS